MKDAAVCYKSVLQCVIKEVWHHLPAALFITALVVILHQQGLLRAVEALSLKVVASAIPHLHFAGSNSPTFETDSKVVVIVLTQQLFETAFNETSPLPQQPLIDVLKNAFPQLREPTATEKATSHTLPKVLVIDLDLSPASSQQEVARPIDDLLFQIAEKGTSIVLTTPAPVVTKGAYEAKKAWIDMMCHCGTNRITFAYPFIFSTYGVALYMNKQEKMLPNEAYRLSRSDPPGGADSRSICEDSGSWNARPKFPSSATNELLNFKFVSALEIKRIDVPTTDPLQIREHDVVFLGGDYGVHDKYLTPVGELDGLYLHAANYFSRQHPVRNCHLLNVLLDIALGVLFGYIFSRLYEAYLANDNVGLLVLNLGAPLILAYVFVISAAYLLRGFNVLIHPAPMALGMFLHSDFVRTKKLEGLSYVTTSSSAKWYSLDCLVRAVVFMAVLTWAGSITWHELKECFNND